jgi:hypothetical protein
MLGAAVDSHVRQSSLYQHRSWVVIGFGPGRVARTKVAGLRSCTLTHGFDYFARFRSLRVIR